MIEFDICDSLVAFEPETAYRVNSRLNLAWDIIEETGANLFLTGRAGTGKTTFLRRLREISAKNMVVLAPTGVAAINAKGNTIHSFFQLPFAPYIPGKGFLTAEKKFLNMGKQKKRLISSLSLIVIDEVSMVRPDILDAIDSILRRLRKSTRPFGGVQLLLIGDLRQLPPVVKESEWDILKEHYPSPYFYESHALRRAGFQTVELSVVYRQNDMTFIEMLNGVRDGNPSAQTLAALNSRVKPGFSPTDDEGYIRLTTHNRKATAINEGRLTALSAPQYTFEAEVEGDFPEGAFPAVRSLRLKEGAQVMFIKNDSGANRRFYNGMIGTVTAISEDKISVRPLEGARTPIEVEKAEWENTRYIVDEKTGSVLQESVGKFRQYPLQLAWAITIHKSQGLTFDRAIIDAAWSFAPGQTYVALSRCRSLGGLVLDTPIPAHAIITDTEVNRFIDSCEKDAPDSGRVATLRNEYLFTLMAELFDFEPVRRSFADFSRYVREYLSPRHPELDGKIDALKEAIEGKLCDVGRRFVESYRGVPLSDEHSGVDKGSFFLRVRNGCGYFFETMERLDDFLLNIPRDIENRASAERLNNTFDTLTYIAGIKRLMLEELADTEFSIKNCLKAKAKAVVVMETAPARKIRYRSGRRKSKGQTN